MKKKHSVFNIRGIHFLMSLLLLTGINSELRAQPININLDGCANETILLSTKVIGTPIGVGPITTSSSNGPVTLTLVEAQEIIGGFPAFGCPIEVVCPVAPNPIIVSGITITNNGTTITFAGNILDTWAGHTLRIIVNAQDQVGGCLKTYNIPIIRKPIDLMLVLDNSASMNCCTDINDPTCVSCGDPAKVRMMKLKQAVDVFFNLGTAGGYLRTTSNTPDVALRDKFGAVIFSGTLDVSHSTYVSNPVDPGSLNPYIQGIGTSGGTCIGGGLFTAIESMKTQAAANRARSLILFTDGEDNYNPLLIGAAVPVQYAAAPLPESSYNPAAPMPPYGSCMPFPATRPTFNAEFRNNSDGIVMDLTPGIKISTIGFGLPAGPAGTLLSNLANKPTGPGGTTNIGLADPFNFNTFFTNSFVELLSGSSPQIVTEQRGITKEGMNAVSFVTNNILGKVSFILMGNEGDGNGLRFSVKKDGLDVTRLGRIVDKGSYRLWHIDFPVRFVTGAPSTLKAGGNWTLETQARPGINYQATCIVDDHLLDYDWSFGDPSTHSVGNAISLSVTLKYKGKPVVDSAEVVVMIDRSTADGGTALAKLAVPEKMQTLLSNKSVSGQNIIDPGYSNLGQLKHYSLLQTNAEYVKALTSTTEKITLTNNGDGTYTGQYIPRVTGAHKFTVLINGAKTDIGEIHRTIVQSSVVKLSHISSFSDIKTEVIKVRDQVSGYKFTFLIKDSSKLLLGPAFQEAFELNSSAGSFGPITDNLDGSYSVTLNQIGNTTDPKVGISVYGVRLKDDKVSRLTKSKHTCPSWYPGWLANFFHSIGISCMLGLIISIALILLLLYLIFRSKKK